MAYSELIKNFSRIREYMRDFYIYGFKHREDYDIKSSRSYDNERRRIESWLKDFMSFRYDNDGKRVFISIDSRNIVQNPLYNAFKAKSFTSKDIMLNFYILDILCNGNRYSINEIVDKINYEYLQMFETFSSLDETTVRIKLKEYEKLGILTSLKRGKKLYYSITTDIISLEKWMDAIAFFSEENTIGIIGAYLLDKTDKIPDCFRFKHHYILHALESEVLCELLYAIDEKRKAELQIYRQRFAKSSVQTVTPLKILVSTQGGRCYLLAKSQSPRQMRLYRIDSIKTVKLLETDGRFDMLTGQAVNFMQYLWGVSSGNELSIDHIEMSIHIADDEGYILQRLEREKRNGIVESIGNGLYRFTADVYDANEMLPWIRTYIGRICSLKCSNNYVYDTFIEDLKEMESIYLEEDDAVS